MDELRLLTKEERKAAYQEVFRASFPSAELKPLSAMERMIAAGEYAFFGLLRNGESVGFACCWQDGNYVLIDYLCVRPGARCGGIGGKLVRLLMETYPRGTVFLGESEAPTGDPARDGLIRRRLGFYERLGARVMSYDCALFGVRYKTLLWAEGTVDEAEAQRRHDGFYRRAFPKLLYAAAVQLPLRAGEGPHPMRDWAERPNMKTDENEVS